MKVKSLKGITFTAILSFIVLFGGFKTAKSQSAELLGGNMLNGALTGTILGVATMGLNDSNDFTPLRIGLGSGIIGGTAIAIYDITTLPRGQQFYISGLFNDGTNSSIIILLDTIYGAAVGAALGASFMLISNDSLTDGLQYGAGLGAWTGFSVGLVDSFILADRNRDFVASDSPDSFSLLHLNGENLSLSLVEPDTHRELRLTEEGLSLNTSLAINLFSLRKSF